jgi:hypothetical protein
MEIKNNTEKQRFMNSNSKTRILSKRLLLIQQNVSELFPEVNATCIPNTTYELCVCHFNIAFPFTSRLFQIVF